MMLTNFGSPDIVFMSCCVIILHSINFDEASLISMMTEGQVFVMNHAQTLDVSCEFLTDEFDMFDNPIVWKKYQRQEEMQINIMGNIFEPFLASNRFEVTFEKSPPRFCLRLKIANLTSEDSGNYTCEVRGRKSTVLAHVTHFIFVRAYVKMLFLTSDNSSAIPTIESRVRQLVVVEGRSQYLRCFSTGGYPTPDMAIFINDREVTDQFSLSSTTSFFGKPGLRLMVTQTERRSDELSLTAYDDNARLRCIVIVPGLMANVTEITVKVKFGPIITCSPAFAYVWQRDVVLRCEVRARPEVTSLFWITDVNGTKLSDQEVTNEHWSLVTARDDGVMETQLHLRQALAHSFRIYTVFAENSIASKTQNVPLKALRHLSSSGISTAHPPLVPHLSTNIGRSNRLTPRLLSNANEGYRFIHSTRSASATGSTAVLSAALIFYLMSFRFIA